MHLPELPLGWDSMTPQSRFRRVFWHEVSRRAFPPKTKSQHRGVR